MGLYVSGNSCGANERNNPTNSCHMTCNGCRDCGPCQCKPGYIRPRLYQECITEQQCHTRKCLILSALMAYLLKPC